jgi:carboxyl-terminal processing protease
MMENRKSLIATVAIVFACSTASFVVGAAGVLPAVNRYFGTAQAPASAAGGSGLDLKRLQSLQAKIHTDYLDPITDAKLTEGALRGMVDAIGDRYSVYMNADEFKQFNERLDATFTGIGVHVEAAPKTGLVTVVAPIKGSPGEKAGLRAGDVIIAVNGKDVTSLTLNDTVALIRGPKGTEVKLTAMREGAAERLEFKITRAVIEVESTEQRMLDAKTGTGYIRIVEFNRQVTERVQKSIADLRGQGMKRLILDLRQDPGGFLDEAVGVSSLFLPAKQPVVYILTKGGQKDALTSKGKAAFDLPLLVLVDGGSASASEIVAGALKATKTGVLMGLKTFGKGLVQTTYPLEDGSGAGLKITTARYLTAGGNAIHGTGITPDVIVDNPNKVLPGNPNDTQLDEALKYIQTMKR